MKKKPLLAGGQWNKNIGLLLLFAVEGILLQYMVSANSFANNLYATNMGATDSEIGLISMVPNLMACALLLPLGVLSDRMKSSRTLPMSLLLIQGAAYFGFGTVPVLGPSRMLYFFLLLAFTAGTVAIYNGQWQTFFGDATPVESRTRVYALRNQAMFVIAVVTPLVCGVLMSAQAETAGKLHVLRVFFYIAGGAAWLQAFVLSRMPACIRQQTEERIPFRESLPEVVSFVKSRRFLLFLLPFVFYYMSWQLDWSMWYLGQVNYVHMNETELSVYNALFNVGQLVAVGVLSRVSQKKSPDFAVIIGAAGLITCPVIMVVSSMLPHTAAFWFFTLGMMILDAPQCVIPLAAMQILLDISPRRNRALIINLYTLLITLSNSLMPWLGVQLYIALGSDIHAVYLFNLTVFVLRVIGTGILVWRYLHLKRKHQLTKTV